MSILLDSLLICVSYEVMRHRYNTIPCIKSMDEATTDADSNFRFCEDIAITGILYIIDFVINFHGSPNGLTLVSLCIDSHERTQRRTYSHARATIQ